MSTASDRAAASAGHVAIRVMAFVVLIPMMVLLISGIIIIALGATADDESTIEVAHGTFATTSHAVVIDDLTDVSTYGSGAGRIPGADAEELTVEVRGQGTNQFFIGIGPADAVDQYLGGASVARITGFADDAATIDEPLAETTQQPANPADQDVWVASEVGGGQQRVDWVADDGDWSLVVMNADARAGVEGTLIIDTDSGVLTALGPPLAIVGGIGTLVAAVALRLTRRRRAPTPR